MHATLVLFACMALPVWAQTATPEQIAAHAKAAQDAERRNDFAAAVRNYEYLARALPRNAQVESNLGVALYFNHDFTRTVHVMTDAMTMDSSLLAPHLFAGLAWYHLSEPDAAAPELSKAVQLNPSDVMAHTWLGYTYVAQGHYTEAAKEFRAACDLEPGNIDAWYALGQSYLQLGEDATAELLATSPDGGRVWQLAGEQLVLQGQREKAVSAFQDALQRRPDLIGVRQELARLGATAAPTADAKPAQLDREDASYQRAHDAELQARSAFEHVAEIAPDSYRAHQILADSSLADGHPEEALVEYRNVLRLKPDLPGIHEAIGKILRTEDKLPEALTEFQQELALQPRSAAADVDAGHTLLLMGDDARAEALLRDALQMDRPPMEAYLLLGRLELRRNDYAAAIASLTRYTSSTKDNSEAYYLLARAYRGAGDKDLMNRALASYKETSADAKQRSLAQQELEAMSRNHPVPEDGADTRPPDSP